jgi:octaprenyl-diphosphate synthase
MSEGELLQIEKTRNLNLSEEVYYDIIRKKTASLIASCCAIGAASAGANPEQIEQMRLFGEKIGMAFQMKDDLLDYGDDDIGKPRGIDLKEKKLTLPIIYTLNQAEPAVKRKIINTIKNHHNNKSKVAEVVDYVNTHNGIAYTKKIMNNFKEEALTILDQLPESEVKPNVRRLVEFIIDRNH